MDTVDFKDAAIRAAKTFVAVLLVQVPAAAVVNGDIVTIRAGVVTAGSAALTFVWNVLLSWSSE